jgi:hypothetical protein
MRNLKKPCFYELLAWGLACGVMIREMAKRLGRSPCKVLGYQTLLELLQLMGENISQKGLFLIHSLGFPDYPSDVI